MLIDVFCYTHKICSWVLFVQYAVLSWSVLFFSSLEWLVYLDVLSGASFLCDMPCEGQCCFNASSCVKMHSHFRSRNYHFPLWEICKNCTYSILLSICIHKTARLWAFIIITIRRLSQLAVTGMCKWHKKVTVVLPILQIAIKLWYWENLQKCGDWIYCIQEITFLLHHPYCRQLCGVCILMVAQV